ncbi:MAG: thiamine-phosphate diphosphorylase [Hyphomicrobium sp. 32-62-53]|nr:MAG: thiamine-phosphate diphosphorylase [Hyphomicrobium sp. 12-62-95]OYY01540.1 MAG: thiamine-phosphate diphosphorylase [Hyphomicrobium sp. 32-62-53]
MTAPPPALFYPIVPDITWLKRLVPLGIKTVQLRIKDTPQESVRAQVNEAVAICRAHGCDLIINDDWQAAIDARAALVHLGQEDLATADLAAIRRAGISIGISTHSEDELETALAADPYYVALGPIYETKLKAMQWAPQGLDKIATWKRRIGSLPLVAIGGITPERAPDVIAAGADSVVVITDFITSPHPEARVSLWLDWARKVIP